VGCLGIIILILSNRGSGNNRDIFRCSSDRDGWDDGRGSSGGIGNMARASRRQLVSVNEKSTVWVTGVKGEHSVVDILLSAF